MADAPYVYAEAPPRPVESGGSRVRVFRRRARTHGAADQAAPADASRGTPWRELLEAAVSDLNEAFRRSGAPYGCRLEEDEEGFVLRILHPGAEPADRTPEEVDELLDPADLPAWLGRLRARLGILIDKTV